MAFAVVGALGAAAVMSRPGSRPLDIVPTLVGTVAGLWALSALLRLQPRAEQGRSGFDRRRLLLGGAGIAVAAAASSAVGQLLGGRANAVAQARADVTVPTVPTPVSVPAGGELEDAGHHAVRRAERGLLPHRHGPGRPAGGHARMEAAGARPGRPGGRDRLGHAAVQADAARRWSP